MIRLEEWVDIKALHNRGMAIRAISKKLKISRNTVRKAIKQHGVPVYQRSKRPSKLDPYKDYLLERLSDFPELSCERLMQEIRDKGYTGGKTILKDFTLPYRIRRQDPVVRFETPPGEQAQVDWSELGTHLINEKPTKLYLFAMILGYSRCLYAEVVTKTDTDTLIACHKHAFSYFGGTTATILYDNMKTVVIKRQAGGNHRFNPKFLDFAGTVGFAPRLCRPYRARTKGKVERVIGYVKDRFFVGRTFSDLSDLNTKLRVWLETEANTRIHTTTGESPFTRLARENLTTVPKRILMERHHTLQTESKKELFTFDSPNVQTRELSVYEEAAR